MNRHDRGHFNSAGHKDAFPARDTGLMARFDIDTSRNSSTDVNAKPDQHTLAGLLLRIGQGDREAFTAFYKLTSKRVYALACKTIVSVEISQDTTQEIYLTVWRDAHRYNPVAGSAMAWLMTITHRRAVDRVRAEQAGANRELRWCVATRSTEYDVVAETVAARAETQTVVRCLDTLSDIQREAISLAYYNCLTYREVAEHLSVPLSTIKTRIRDGLTQLRACLDEA
ncbi:ECF RNA polymerase sigma factor SigK [Arthrobacter monumenti]